jgi:hypothetical protein
LLFIIPPAAHPKVKQKLKAIPTKANPLLLVSGVVTSAMMACESWTLPSDRPPIRREVR